jgi:hypothetical protein
MVSLQRGYLGSLWLRVSGSRRYVLLQNGILSRPAWLEAKTPILVSLLRDGPRTQTLFSWR